MPKGGDGVKAKVRKEEGGRHRRNILGDSVGFSPLIRRLVFWTHCVPFSYVIGTKWTENTQIQKTDKTEKEIWELRLRIIVPWPPIAWEESSQ